jgi:hypothetical protein
MSYVRLLRTHGAAGFFVTTVLGRLGIALYGLSVILTAATTYGDYVRAGLVGGAFAGAEAVGGPIFGRFADRHGQRRTLAPAAALHLVAVSGLAFALLAGAPVALAVAAAALGGASAPQLGALAAARWSHLLRGDPRLETALSLEAVANDVAFIAGPLAVATVASLLGPAHAAAIACLLVVVAALVLAVQDLDVGTRAPGPRVGRELIVPGLANLLLGLLFGTAQLAVAALARARGAEGLAGLYYLTMSLGSLAASAVYGLIRWRGPVWYRVVGAILLVSVGAVAVLTVGGFAALFVVGLGVGPLIVVTGTLVERRAGPGRITQAFALMSALSAAGIALAGPVGGAAVQAWLA